MKTPRPDGRGRRRPLLAVAEHDQHARPARDHRQSQLLGARDRRRALRARLHPQVPHAGRRRLLDEVASLNDKVSVEEVNFVLEKDRAAAYGVTPGAINEQVSALIGGLHAKRLADAIGRRRGDDR